MSNNASNYSNKSETLHRSGVFWQMTGWLRDNLFNNWWSSAVTIIIAYLVIRVGWSIVDWAFINAVWNVPSTPQGPDSALCRALQGTGACWAVIAEKYRFILFGTYPFDEQWRPLLCILLFIALYVISAMRRFWNLWLIPVWVLALALIGTLMWGGVFGLPRVSQENWGGLVITLMLATFGIALAFPLAIFVALGRRSNLPAIRIICIGYVELIRGVPLISLLFMCLLLFPLFLPEGFNIDKLLRAQVAIIIFAAAYLAEVVRGGLQVVPKGQYEAADALGLPYWKKTGFVILPQALRLVIPPLVNTMIGFFKDTSLVLIIGLFDLLNAGKASVLDPIWQGFSVEVYVFCGLIYFIFCFAMSRYSQNLEQELNRVHRR